MTDLAELEIENDSIRRAMLQAVGGKYARVDNERVFGVFVAPHTPLQFGDMVVDSDEPQFVCCSADLPDVDDHSTIVRINNTTDYRIASIQPDGTGITLLRLRE